MSFNSQVNNRYKYKNEGFDKMLTELLSNITEEQLSKLPSELQQKIFKSKDPNVNHLTDGQKDFVLTAAFNRKIVKAILSEDEGLTIEQFAALRDTWKKKRGSDVNAMQLAEDCIVDGEFFLSGQDLYDGFSYMALICHSPVFKMAINTRKAARKYKHPNREFAVGVENIINMFVQYESFKKKIVIEFELENMSEWYCLLYFYSGEKKGSSAYTDKFKYSFSSSIHNIRLAMARLKKIGLLGGRGGPKNHMVYATPAGRALVDKVMVKYILNY